MTVTHVKQQPWRNMVIRTILRMHRKQTSGSTPRLDSAIGRKRPNDGVFCLFLRLACMSFQASTMFWTSLAFALARYRREVAAQGKRTRVKLTRTSRELALGNGDAPDWGDCNGRALSPNCGLCKTSAEKSSIRLTLAASADNSRILLS